MSAAELIKRFEGLRLTAYPDPASGGAPWTIGYGHTGSDVHPGLVITQEQADKLLADDLAKAAADVDRLVTVLITEGERDALTSFVFNLGPSALQHSTLLRLLNAGATAAASEEFDRWTHGAGRILVGLVKRRAAEKAMFLERPQQESNLRPTA